MTKREIFMTGYAGRDINDLKPMLAELDALLIDIRFAPHSEIMHWRKIYLKTLLGGKYRHIPNLGNRTFRENEITIQNLQLGLETILNLEGNLVLMCVCREPENCHRRIIERELNRREIETTEIFDWKKSSRAAFSIK